MTQSSLFPRPTSIAKTPFDDQEGLIVSFFDYFSEKSGSPLFVMPTGGGKSLCMAEVIKRANMYYPGTKFIVLSHVALLLKQNAEALLGQWPEADISFYSDSIGQKNLSGDTIFAGIQSIYKKAYDLRHSVDLILVDEVHTVGPEDGSMYRKFFDDMKVINPNIKIAGFTATPFRAGYGYLHKGKNALFTDIAYEIGIAELIGRGRLCPVVTPDGGVETKMDTTGVKSAKGDFIGSQLAKAVDKDPITKACVTEIIAHGEDRKKWIVFTVDISHCTHVYEEMLSRGISCEMVHSKLDPVAWSKAVDKFKNGDTRCLVNVSQLTTGADFPAIDLIALMRPTRSPVLYVQMAGRAMRVHPNKTDALFLDFGGVIEELGPVDAVHIKEPGDGGGQAPIKYCPGPLPNNKTCGQTLYASVMLCPHCGYEFPDPGINIDSKASDAAVLSSQLKAKEYRVSRVGYYRHKKEGKPDSLRIDYLCGFETYRDWKFFESTAQKPREEACNWWRAMAGTLPPNTITDTLVRVKEIRQPLYITVKKIGQFNEVIGARFTEEETEDDAP